VAAKTGNTYISEIMTDSVQISMANLEFSTTLSSNLPVLGCPSLSQSLGYTFIELVMDENLQE